MISSEGSSRRSSIPCVPVNYKGSKRQKAGNSLIPRFMFKQAKPAIDYFSLKKDSAKTKKSVSYSPTVYCEPLKIKGSYISRKAAKKVESLLSNFQDKPRQKNVTLPGKSKIPVPKKTNVSTPLTTTTTRTSHRNCTTCSHRASSLKNTVNTVKKKNSRVRFNLTKDNQDNQDNQVDYSTSTSIKKPLQNLFKKRVSPLPLIKSDDLSPNSNSHKENTVSPLQKPSTPTLIKNDDLSPTSDLYKENTVSPLQKPSTPTLIKNDDLSPTFNSHNVSPLQSYTPTSPETNDLVFVCTPTLIKSDDLSPPTSNSHKETNDLVFICTPTLIKSDDLSPPTSNSHEKNDLVLVCSSLKIKYTSLKIKPEASISITHSNVEVSTTSIIKPELASILLYKAEKDLSSTKQQADENVENAPTLVGNVCKNIVRFSNFISKIKTLV
ncbi:hypothetical protein RhiirA5_400124 [Rhizophagus irregularis]|uniref:Uncharacterized protein n=3 Tax=Rhizophagus irregularis TaxID=588596 RepID=A0A2I1EJH0_9GLOM|nr:hypothetical protein GLOIN_2v1479202 [Rhizophagus irregularis DAOM 181602=DAOM 197198]PKC06895.1 hypothetical protein RhiirA5_400124 [Rhizophagus irregularis]PKC68457.1 hypothetical protein RhiirA1_507073 [Rhizophagus irregularis]PKY22268.1 hypothetical protein RhiirB3_502842 [Rhizophagus irregularis]POG70548.1 hypothetical protein GLOIN_2v1479202 [Rhizophagus irregularis DAOM 181602=DAOM 197198]UZO20744.1 hypothetical protein OCT59_013162 [Rhizophagus irregularis]|eukprot:XP_025177414.1 hypothetical protein GLOIN_2v1479202 [Rhizophagus irregularis DAOM 181602=DAOM 197198]